MFTNASHARHSKALLLTDFEQTEYSMCPGKIYNFSLWLGMRDLLKHELSTGCSTLFNLEAYAKRTCIRSVFA